MSLIDVSLDDKFDLSKPRVFTTGTQALVRMCLMQAAIDQSHGLNTAGYVTGYRGSPLGGLDGQFPRAAKQLAAAQVTFQPALNEDLAATALWGSQQAELRGEGKYDGVFGMWYGKGPGVDRSGDVFRHANLAGSAKNGGVLVLMGDDHTCESSTTAHQSEFALVDAMIPVLNPANIEELVSYGLHGWALSRFSGAWVGLKAVKDNIESSGSVTLRTEDFASKIPSGFDMPPEGLNIRLGDTPLEAEARLHQHKLDAVRSYVRENELNKVTYSGGQSPRIGVISTGKSYFDTVQALEFLGIDEARAEAVGLRLMKIAMPWPLEPEGIKDFARGLDRIVVVEEKRGLIEDQLRAILYGGASTPLIEGKRDAAGATLFQAEAALNPVQIAARIGTRCNEVNIAARAGEALAMLNADNAPNLATRKPYFCAGCPHNTSTNLPEGTRGYAGIGCHYMALFMERGVDGFTHMGGEGANWVGEEHFSTTEHMFQNIGDGTYNHSGLMAIRAAVAVGTNITYKLLYNDAVAMTGGQAHDGSLDVYRILAEVRGMGVKRVILMADDLERIDKSRVPSGIDMRGREELDATQREMAQIKGVSVLVYDQTCAAEKRRRRKRGLMDDPDRRVVINDRVCEGCGDCGQVSNCVAITPKETTYGRKRAIDQSACNKDFSCVKGFCPSFVSVRGITEGSKARDLPKIGALEEPATKPVIDGTYSIALTGVGGTGVVTVGAILGMAAHLMGKGVGLIDMAGLAQKGGAVVSHIQIAETPSGINAIRIARGGADLVLGCDVVTSAGDAMIAALNRTSGRAVINTHNMMTGDFVSDPDFKLPVDLMVERIRKSLPPENSSFVNATAIAKATLGDTIAANMFMAGVAYQKGHIPLSAEAIEQALRMNGVAVEFNVAAFRLGRQWVLDPTAVETSADQEAAQPETLDQLISARARDLTAYQSKAYARRYVRLASLAKDADGEGAFAWAVGQQAHKLMAYKDEYEVARHFGPDYLAGLRAEFGEDAKFSFHLAPPIFAKTGPDGQPLKREYGGWMLRGFALLRRMKFLRGTPFDPFGRSQERRAERALIKDYEALIRDLSSRLNDVNYDAALALAELPAQIRGYGHVKAASLEAASQRRDQLLAELEKGAAKAA